MNTLPNPLVLATRDWFAQYVMVLSGITGIFLAATLFAPPPLAAGRTAVGVLLLAEIGALTARVIWLAGLMSRGVPVPGHVQKVRRLGAAGSRKVADYRYTWDGEDYVSVCFDGSRFTQGQDIVVLVDPDRPCRSLVADLFRPH